MTQEKMKKVLCLVLASVMAFGMTACGGVPSKNSSSSSEKESSSSSSSFDWDISVEESSSSLYSSEEESSSSSEKESSYSSEEESSSSSEESSYSSEKESSSSSEESSYSSEEESSSSSEESSYSSEEESSYSSEEESSSSLEDSSESSSSEATSSVEEFLPNGMPNYDDLPADDMIFAAWYLPETHSKTGDGHPTVAQLCQDIADCGFNWVFAMGEYMGALGSGPIYESMLDNCDDLGLKVLFDITKMQDNFASYANMYKSHKSFVGFNYDEPFMDTRTNAAAWLGLNQLNQYTVNYAEQFPDLNFLVNLNPIWFTQAQNQSYTYGEYVNALMEKIYQPYQTANASAYKWLSADDYPFFTNANGSRSKFGYSNDWLKGVAYLAQTKKNTQMDNVVANFFIQAMPFGPNNRNYQPSYNDLRFQTYTLMAFGYDAVSFFCYGSPRVLDGGEFTASQEGLVGRDGKKNQSWYDSQKILQEVNKFQHTYMQFNDNWLGVYPVGSNAEFDVIKAINDDGITSPVITNMRFLKGISSIESNQSVLVGSMQDKYRNPGYLVVNYNDTRLNKTATTEIAFKSGYSKAWVYIDGVQNEVTLTNGKLTLNLDVGEGVFVIPIAD